MDLEGTALQIKTDSTLGSGDELFPLMKDKDGNEIARLSVWFSSAIKYKIMYCTYINSNNWKDLPVQPPVEVEKVWIFTKTETALTISCNEVEVLNYQFADSSYDDCVPKWGGNVVEQISFYSWDTASDFYRSLGKLQTTN